MNNEEAINELLQCYSLYSPFKTAKKTNEAISMAIAALKGKAEEAPAIPLPWIDSYIKTCEIFDLRANGIPAEKIIKTMVKIWEQENPGGKKGGEA